MQALTAGVIVTGVGMCVVEELLNTPESGGVPPKMRVCLLVPGNIAWDGCDCGQFAQTIQASYPTKSFPADASEDPAWGMSCPPGRLAFQVVAQILRCVPGMSGGLPPTLPTCGALQASALQIQADAFALRRGIGCCLATYKSQHTIFAYTVGRSTFIGPEGGCAGVELTYKFQLT